ncbi:hypothetical protein SMSP2_02135 [Limihaloglobus sulfuriphilus]|uniref:DUF4434 domain-containing protein n=1 Tax=Limihaloglobus sulfuriphilus TaxID=1851148 RepID=A0A1Q2MHI4_9BACT|nr:DUF4434 domain-containing protein [Limihaloglobus sulfuriphilus]AQQ71757.1 hypothetical protein SMSP2_02135 [Limihaloglobus sulfuriphilus]
MAKITGTFLDEISHDIPSANWGPQDWARDFRAMKETGIDTVIIIRSAYRRAATFDSEAIKKSVGSILPVPVDLLDLFLSLAEENGMDLFFGTYDSGEYWMSGNYRKEVDINKAFTEEAVNKYGHRKAFKGWYMCHEIDTYNDKIMKVYRELGRHLKELKDMPILISPFIHGKKQFSEDPTNLSEHEKQWDRIFAEITDCVDIVAFQDGHVDFHELHDYLAVNSKLAKKYGITSWVNVETFDRDMPIKFMPLPWPAMLHKIQAAQRAKVDKLITFEFSHFLSPNSIYPAAHNLHKRYCEWLAESGISEEALAKGEADPV